MVDIGSAEVQDGLVRWRDWSIHVDNFVAGVEVASRWRRDFRVRFLKRECYFFCLDATFTNGLRNAIQFSPPAWIFPQWLSRIFHKISWWFLVCVMRHFCLLFFKMLDSNGSFLACFQTGFWLAAQHCFISQWHLHLPWYASLENPFTFFLALTTYITCCWHNLWRSSAEPSLPATLPNVVVIFYVFFNFSPPICFLFRIGKWWCCNRSVCLASFVFRSCLEKRSVFHYLWISFCLQHLRTWTMSESLRRNSGSLLSSFILTVPIFVNYYNFFKNRLRIYLYIN